MTIQPYHGPIFEGDVCPIGREQLKHGSTVQTSCGHLYDRDNLKAWLVTYEHENCPMCNCQLDANSMLTLFEKISKHAYKTLENFSYRYMEDFCYHPNNQRVIFFTITSVGIMINIYRGYEEGVNTGVVVGAISEMLPTLVEYYLNR